MALALDGEQLHSAWCPSDSRISPPVHLSNLRLVVPASLKRSLSRQEAINALRLRITAARRASPPHALSGIAVNRLAR